MGRRGSESWEKKIENDQKEADETPEGEQESIDPAGEQNVTESGGEGETVEKAETVETDDVAGDGAFPDESSSRDG